MIYDFRKYIYLSKMSAGCILATEAIVIGAVLLYKSQLLTMFGWYNKFTANSTVKKIATCYAGIHNKCLDVIYISHNQPEDDGSKYLVLEQTEALKKTE